MRNEKSHCCRQKQQQQQKFKMKMKMMNKKCAQIYCSINSASLMIAGAACAGTNSLFEIWNVMLWSKHLWTLWVIIMKSHSDKVICNAVVWIWYILKLIQCSCVLCSDLVRCVCVCCFLRACELEREPDHNLLSHIIFRYANFSLALISTRAPFNNNEHTWRNRNYIFQNVWIVGCEFETFE